MSSLTTNYDLIKPGVNDPTDEDLWGTYLNTDLDTIDTTMKSISDVADSAYSLGGVPIATILPYAGATAPTKYALCYGQAISRTTYAALFTAIGTTYGTGDGSTTFNLPDLRGRVPAGQDDMGGTSANRLTGQTGGVNGDTLGGVGGTETHKLTVTEMPAHTHGPDTSLASSFYGDYAAGGLNGGRPTGGGTQLRMMTTGSTGGGGAHNNMQPTIILNYIIKIEQ